MRITDKTNLNHIYNAKKETEESVNEIGSGKREIMDEASLQMLIDSLGSEVSSSTQEIMNSNNSIAMMQIASSSLDSLSKMGDEINQLSVQYNNGALNSDQKSMIENQAQALKRSMSDVINETNFNGKNLFSSTSFEDLGVDLSAVNPSLIEVSNQDTLKDFSNSLNDAYSKIASVTQKEVANINNLSEKIVAHSHSKSINEDTDIAQNFSNASKESLKLNAALLAQAHQQNVLANSMSKLLG